MTDSHINWLSGRTVIIAGALAIGLGACAADPSVTGSVPLNYRDRHPIVVTEGAEVLDIIPGGGPGGLTERQREDIRSFARMWREEGRGLVAIQLPRGGATDAAAAHSVGAVRTELTAGGVPSRAISTGYYSASHPSQLAPMRIVFPKLKAEIASQCGQWPENLGNSLSSSMGRNNTSYTNFGCAYQKNMAAMIADPEDIVRPRAEATSSATRRAAVIGAYNAGEPTATKYSDNSSSLSGIGQ